MEIPRRVQNHHLRSELQIIRVKSSCTSLQWLNGIMSQTGTADYSGSAQLFLCCTAKWQEEILAPLFLPSVNSSLFQHTSASHKQGKRISHHCLWQRRVQYRSPFYHGGYLKEFAKGALNFTPKFVKECQVRFPEELMALHSSQESASVLKSQWRKMIFTQHEDTDYSRFKPTSQAQSTLVCTAAIWPSRTSFAEVSGRCRDPFDHT